MTTIPPSPTRPLRHRLRRSRRTNGILDARIRKLRAGAVASRLRADLLSRAARSFGQPLPPRSDTFTFNVAQASQVALFFSKYGSAYHYHIRKFNLDYDRNSADRRLDSPKHVQPYIMAIKNLPLLEEISFAGLSIGPRAAWPLAEVLRTKTTLRRADFSDCFGSRGNNEIVPAMDALVSAFLLLPNLAAIDLSSNALGPIVERPFLHLTREHTPLQELNLNDTGMGPEIGVAFAQALVALADNKATAGAPPLRVLLLDRNKLIQDDDDPEFGMPEWAAAFAAHPNLQRIHLKDNRIKHAGLTLLLNDGLAHVHALEVLDLADSTFTERGGTHSALANAVGGWPALRELNLDDSLLGSRGAALLFPALAAVQPSRLESLRMVQCNLKPANTTALAGLLWRLPELRELTLDTNNFPRNDEGYQALVTLLQRRAEERGAETSVDEVAEDAYSDPSLSPPPTTQEGEQQQQGSPRPSQGSSP